MYALKKKHFLYPKPGDDFSFGQYNAEVDTDEKEFYVFHDELRVVVSC